MKRRGEEEEEEMLMGGISSAEEGMRERAFCMEAQEINLTSFKLMKLNIFLALLWSQHRSFILFHVSVMFEVYDAVQRVSYFAGISISSEGGGDDIIYVL